MSVIHEALRRARQSRPAKSEPSGASEAPQTQKPALTVKSAAGVPVWLWWGMLLFVLVEGTLYLRERNLRLHSEEKMHSAYLELNDVRGEYLEKSDTVRRSASELREARTKLNEALRSKTEVLSAKEAVEFDNLDKQKKLSELTKQAHEAEMSKYRLQSEVLALKAELARASSAGASETVSK